MGRDSLKAMLRDNAMLRKNASGSSAPARREAECDAASLGLRPSASDAEVKRADRLLVRQYHPDEFEGRGFSENMRDLAMELVHDVFRAYEAIKARRSGRSG